MNPFLSLQKSPWKSIMRRAVRWASTGNKKGSGRLFFIETIPKVFDHEPFGVRGNDLKRTIK
jgi:hypothetical protein